VRLLSTLGIGTDARSFPPGVVVAATPTTNLGDNTAALKIAHDFVAAIARHRHWDRPDIDAVPA
jgi:catalase